MESRQIVNERLTFPIKQGKTYKPTEFCTWEELINTERLKPTDIIIDFFYKEEKENGFASMKTEDELETYYTPSVTVIRKRPENDEEYSQRMQLEASAKKQQEEKERLDYLRLKAKFEGNDDKLKEEIE